MTLGKQAHAFARFVLPAFAYQRMQAIRSRRHQASVLNHFGLIGAAKRYLERNGSTVRHGPFAGMVYPVESATNRHSIPKLLGIYESELHGIIRTVASRRYDCVIDVGSAEGYYAVGLARLLGIPVYAYEPEPAEKRLCSQMASLNGVSQFMNTRDLFLKRDVPEFTGKRALMICDCEGFETHIFVNENVGLMANWDVLIELHGPSAESLPLLSWPHPVQVIPATVRNTEGYPELEGIGDPAALLSELRGEKQHWLWHDAEAQRT